MQGLDERVALGKPVDKVASVASFFVSRVDVAVDGLLDKLVQQTPAQAAHYQALQGKAAVANSKLAYRQFEEAFATPLWQKLAAAGARVQRPLWASTSTKNPHYPDLIYVDTLIGPYTVNTMPPQTLQAFADHGVPARTVDQGIEQARADLVALANTGISLDQVTQELEADGVKKFIDSFEQLLATIEERRKQLIKA